MHSIEFITLSPAIHLGSYLLAIAPLHFPNEISIIFYSKILFVVSGYLSKWICIYAITIPNETIALCHISGRLLLEVKTMVDYFIFFALTQSIWLKNRYDLRMYVCKAVLPLLRLQPPTITKLKMRKSLLQMSYHIICIWCLLLLHFASFFYAVS